MCKLSLFNGDLHSEWQEEHPNEYKKENQAPGKIVEESKSPVGAQSGRRKKPKT